MTKTITGFHNSPPRFAFPSYEMLTNNRVNHANGALGLWYSTVNSWQKGFGGICYKLEVGGEELLMSFSDFSEMCRGEIYDTEGYKQKREQWIKEGYSYLSIIEHNGRNDMGIVLDFDGILSFEEELCESSRCSI